MQFYATNFSIIPLRSIDNSINIIWINSCNYVSGWLHYSSYTGSVHILASNYECEGMLCKRCKGVSIPNNLLSLSRYKPYIVIVMKCLVRYSLDQLKYSHINNNFCRSIEKGVNFAKINVTTNSLKNISVHDHLK